MRRAATILVMSAALGLTSACSSSGSGTTSGTSGTGTTGGAPYTGSVALGQVIIYLADADFTRTPATAGSCIPGATGTPCCYVSPAAESSAATSSTSSSTGSAGTTSSGSTSSSSTSSSTTSSGGQSALVSAGTITLTDGTKTLGTLTYGASGYAPLEALTDPTLSWAPGDTVTITAAGNDGGVDAFTGTIVMPSSITGVTPSFASTVDVSISAAFTITWTPGTTGNVGVLIQPSGGGSITCLAPTTAGTVTIPASVLGNVTSTDTGKIYVTPTGVAAFTTAPANANVALVGAASVTDGTLQFGP